jgi:predicted ATP-binding protein involved in virulence
MCDEDVAAIVIDNGSGKKTTIFKIIKEFFEFFFI